MSDITKRKDTPTRPYYQWKAEYKDKFLRSNAFNHKNGKPGPGNEDWELLHDLKNNLRVIEYDATQILALAAEFGFSEKPDETVLDHTQFLDEILIETGLYPQFASAFDTVSHQSRLLGIEPYVDITTPNQALHVAIQIATECANRVSSGYTSTPLNDDTDPHKTNREWLKYRIKVHYKPLQPQPYGFRKKAKND